jgi:tRNA G18 (ribose-2'-O)-methylase SpoU
MEILKANIGSIIRLVLGILGGCGIVISTQETDAVIQGITQVVAGASILIPAVWAIVKNWKAAKAK